MGNTAKLRHTVRAALEVVEREVRSSGKQELCRNLRNLLAVLEHGPLQERLAAAELQLRIVDLLKERPRLTANDIADALNETLKSVNGSVSSLKRQKLIKSEEYTKLYRGDKVIRYVFSVADACPAGSPLKHPEKNRQVLLFRCPKRPYGRQ